MKVKKYVGDTIQDTIFKVKADLGSDAIILNTRKYRKGGFLGFFGKKQVEVMAALEEEQKNTRALKEIGELKELVSSLNEQVSEDKFTESLPPRLEEIYNYLSRQGIKDDTVRQVINSVRDREQIYKSLKREIAELLTPVEPISLSGERTTVFFTGPTGVGKTTTVAKLAARFVLEEERRVGLITADTYRIAAVQQLQTYSEIVDIPIEVVYNLREFEDTLQDDFADYDLVLVDTAGTSWNNRKQLGYLQQFAHSELVDETHLLVSLNVKGRDLRVIIDKFSSLNPDKVILTKLDETTTYGEIVNLREEYDLVYSYYTDGQEVPDDIGIADPETLTGYIAGDLNV